MKTSDTKGNIIKEPVLVRIINALIALPFLPLFAIVHLLYLPPCDCGEFFATSCARHPEAYN